MRAPPASSAPGPPTPTSSAASKSGQACYIQRGAATFVQVARPKPSPLTLLPPPAAPDPAARVPEPRHDPAPEAWPDPVSLDDVFGPGAPR